MGRDETVEGQEWNAERPFPGQIVIGGMETALRIAGEWGRLDTIWTDGSRQDNGTVGAVCGWRTQGGVDRTPLPLGN